jgi:hypothetical protein
MELAPQILLRRAARLGTYGQAPFFNDLHAATTSKKYNAYRVPACVGFWSKY